MKVLTDIHTDFAAVATSRDVMAADNSRWHTLRQQAKAQFERNGLPGRKEEDWKYTSLWSLGQEQFKHQVSQPGIADIHELKLVEDAYRLVIIDGRVDLTASSLDKLPEGLTVSPLSQSIERASEFLNQQISIEKPGFNALNTMLMNEGIFIEVAANTQIVKPIELIVVNTGRTEHYAMHLRNLIVLNESSQATFIETYAGNDKANGLTEVVTEVNLAENAELFHYKLQREALNHYHIATLAAKQAANSKWHNNNISLGGKLARNDIHSQLLGEQSHVTLNGLYLVTGEQHVDNHTRIDHAVPNTTSDEMYKGVLDQQSHAVFNGKVIVHKDAQKTDANQSNRNLLLSRGCEIDTKPEMEIYADDVKCGHGSAVGQINEDQLFFLRARGLDEISARSLLTFAFAVDVIERISNQELKKSITAVIEKRLPKGGTHE
ncbi:Fe-S cluster assembly protein SufD [Methylophaga sp.]|uniref:Fe-S cluster assembly protein SufD n=1 Tax=Methylophaga sp. TaxID=2024840 RepID=UPI00271E5B9D|nr:Fe-S cluster assembly protein SufD [Methylophaga sp.]MDO8827438.1 Fe-S cluster assembly protein SufD [Methylophaga sp.]